MSTMPLLRVEDLRTSFLSPEGTVRAVDGVSFELQTGETLGIVGESGCGKTVACLSILRLIDEPGRIEPGSSIRLRDNDLTQLSAEEMRAVRGNEISMVFQEPLTSLNPVWTVGSQIAEAVRAHREVSAGEARARAIEMLELVGIPDPHRRVDDYPHVLSGGMRQRAALLRTFLTQRNLILLDEPFGALDALTRRELQDWLLSVWKRFDQTILFITHDVEEALYLGDRVVVLSSRPGSVQDILEVSLPRPRRQGMVALPEFGHQVSHLLESLGVQT